MTSVLTLSLTSSIFQRKPNRNFPTRTRKSGRRSYRPQLVMAVQPEDRSPQKSTKLVTFLGKGGSGKTTSAVFAAQYYAKAGLNTCLVLHSQDPTAEYLMGCKIGTSPTLCNNNLSVVRLETTRMLLEPLNRLKQADTRLNLTQGVLEGVVGEELGILPGMDSIFSAFAIENFVGNLKTVTSKSRQEKFDVVVYDGISTEETLRMIGSTERARWYLKYLRNMAENTDIGRLTAPSFLRLVDETVRLNGGGLRFDGKTSAEMWDNADQILERASAAFSEPSKFGSYIVMDTNCPMSVRAALRYWGCAIQAGGHVAGAFSFARPQSCIASVDLVQEISPLPFACIPFLSTGSVDWNTMLLRSFSEDAQNLLSAAPSSVDRFQSPIKFDPVKKSVSLFMPGFDKSEIKLYQYRGGSELLVEAGDQRRIIRLPSGIQGKVGGAKFTNKNLVVTMRQDF